MQQLETKQSTLTRIYINSYGFRGKTNSSIYFFLIYLFIHMINICAQESCCRMDDSAFGRKYKNMRDKYQQTVHL